MIYKGKHHLDRARSIEIDHSGNEFVEQFIHGRAEGPIKMEVRAQ